MNFALYKTMMKSNIKGFSSFGFGSAMYVALMTALYPMIADNAAEINKLMDVFPDALKQVIGVESLSSYGGFISAEYFGLFFPIILGIFSVMTASQLLAKLVDHRSMAYLLSTKVSRAQIAFTQAVVLVNGLILIVLLTFIGGVLAGKFLLDEQYSIGLKTFFEMNLVGFLLFFAVGGYSFLISSLCNDEKLALGIAGGFTFVLYGLDMIGKLTTDFEWLRNLTPFSLFEPSLISSGEANVLLSSLVLFGIGLVTYLGAGVVFKHRNLPL
ncbi:ABC transporter permease subunit [Bacillus taeanensis]|uniref:Permease n=1 Tax=Bacillus taeanensis TaxID=273032 RepID=A0A366XXA9_9BACI|nr:ABC transporter permease subunit [Bacillus taeanensis]RBW68773.1 permease [Bacillus taeanensis]